jgi:hypothetical protein
MIEAAGLYDPDPRARWAAARELRVEHAREIAAEIAQRFSKWPKFWWGVVNPWLVFIGPSPGNSGSKAIDWTKERMPTIGEVQLHVSEYEDSAGFWSRMRDWTANAYALAGIFPNDRTAALGSVLLANLVPINQGDSTKISQAELDAAIPGAAALLEGLRPRVFVLMDKRISRPLLEEFQRRGFVRTSDPIVCLVPAKSQTYSHYKPRIWNLAKGLHRILVAESPQHPSKRNFYDPLDVDRYLASILERANA